MNAERLHAIVAALSAELNGNGIDQKLTELVASLQALAGNPHPSHQQTFAQRRAEVYAALDHSPSDAFSPLWRQILAEIGGDALLGSALRKRIDDSLQNNPLTPAVAAGDLQSLQRDVHTFKTAIDNARSAFRHLKIKDETLAQGECEVGVMIPRASVENSVEGLATELNELSFILRVFSEIATGSTEHLSIRALSSSELLVFLNASMPTAACLAVAIERIIALYKSILEIRKLKHDLVAQGVPDEATVNIDQHANSKMEDGINTLSIEIVNEHYQGESEARKHELRNSLRISLNKLADRIDRGFNVDVRVGEIAKGSKDVDQKTKESIARIREAASNAQFLNLSGQPILRLAERNETSERRATPRSKGAGGRARRSRRPRVEGAGSEGES